MHAMLTWFSITQQDFFETTYFNQPDIAMPAAWKQLAELTRLDWLSTALELYRTINDIMIPPPEPYDIMQNDPNDFMQDSGNHDDITDPISAQNDPVQASEGAIPIIKELTDAGMSSHGCQHKMSRAMAKSVSQHDLYSSRDMFYMVAQGISNGKMKAELCHNSHLELKNE